MCKMSSGLSLLSCYSSDDEIEEKPRLPPPSGLMGKFTSEIDDTVVDNPELHDGRTRSYPHQRGNWNSIIYIPFRNSVPFDLFCEQIIDLCKPIGVFKKIEEPHVSLTRTFVLLHHWIDNFVSAVRSSLQSFQKFDLQFDGFKVYCNEDCSRTFLALTVGLGRKAIYRAVQSIDKCLRDYKLHPFYEEASFHMSIIWTLGDRKAELESLVPQLNSHIDSILDDDVNFTISVPKYICKIGHKVYTIKLY